MNNNPEKDVTDYTETEKNPKITLDTILLNDIGQFGKYQLRSVMLSAIIAIFAAWAGFEFIFTTARISTRCVIPECDIPQPEWSPHWLPNALPATGPITFDNCRRFGNKSSILRQVDNNTCPSTLFDRNDLQPCEEYVYQNTHSVTYDFNLACDEWSRGLLGTIQTLGTLTALPISGYVSDRWGRRVAFILGAFNTCWMGVVRYWTNTYIGFMLSEFFEAAFGSGFFSSYYILLMEIMGPKYRVVGGVAMNTFASVGQVMMGLIAWSTPNWRYLTLILYIPQISTVVCYWLVLESVRWYMSKGRFGESEAILRKIAKINGRQLSDQSLQALRYTAIEEAKIKAKENGLKGQEPWLIVQVFQHKRILLRCMITPLWWITNTLIFYGLSLNAVNLIGNSYLNFVAVASVEIPGFWTAYILLNTIGRKAVLIIAFWLCATCQIAYILLPEDLYAVSLTIYLIAKFAIAMSMTTVYIYTTELYPTKYRHSLFAFSSMIGRFGSILAPLTPAIGAQWFKELPFALFALFALVSGSLTFFTPETRNIKLPDTFEEALQLDFKNKNTEK